jgi:hypothetical protein
MIVGRCRIGSAKPGPLVAWAIVLVVACASSGCREDNGSSGDSGTTVSPPTVKEVIERQGPRLMAMPGVVGLYEAECAGKPCIRIMLLRRDPDLERRLPRRLEGYPVEFEVTGEIRPLGK